MKNVFRILLRDLKNIIKNPAAIAVMIGLFFIPSLYAWVNIKANWDPYASTKQIPVAVVNNDTGSVLNNKSINIGDQIISDLKKNDSIGWEFTSDWQGNYGLNEGKYYALIEIPSNFSANLISLTSTVPQKPKIVYKANEKVNAIATKITDVAKDKLTEEIKNEIIDSVNNEIFQNLNVAGGHIQGNKPQILELVNSINDASLKLKDIDSQLLSADKDVSLLQDNFNNSKDNLNKASDSLNTIENMIRSSRDLTLQTKVQFNILTSNLKQNMIDLQTEGKRYQDQLENLRKETINLQDKNSILKIINDLKDTNQKVNNSIDSAISSLNGADLGNLSNDMIDNLNKLKTSNNNILNAIEILERSLNITSATGDIESKINNIILLNSTLNTSLTSINNLFYNSVVPLLNVSADNLLNITNKSDSTIDGIKVLNPQLKALMNLGIANGDVSKSKINNIRTKLDEFRDVLSPLQDETSNINENSLDKFANIMTKNPDIMSEFLASPLDVEEVQVYDINVFGIGLTPFYTVLGIWVGSLLMLALLTTECKDLKDQKETTIMQKHFGKLLLFLLISFVQTLIVALGDVFLLKVYPQNFALFIGISFLTSFVFTVLIYTLVSLFGNAGKAIAVIVMVFQIAGSGGIYPIQTNPRIFGVLQPLWPFTYAIDAYRQAIAGPTWNNTLKDIGILLLFAIVFIILGLLKRHIYKITEFFERKFKSAEL